MSDLTDAGLLHAPHISAGRLPTELGLRLFVDGLMQVGDLTDEERRAIEVETASSDVEALLENAAARLSGLTQSASLVVTQKSDAPLRHIEFVAAGPGNALAVLVYEDGRVENRALETPGDLPASALIAAGNYLNARLRGRSLTETRAGILNEIETHRAELDELTARLVRQGVADISRAEDSSLIVRGAGHLLDETALGDIERVRKLFEDLERKRDVIDLLSAAKDGTGVKIFIGDQDDPVELDDADRADADDNREQEISGLNDRILRLAAELENTRRRAAREKADAGKYAIAGFARDLLAVADNFERALRAAGDENAAPTADAMAGLIDGVRMTEKELLTVLERHGVHRIEPAGEKFDPNLHQAVAQVPGGAIPTGHVVDVAQPGFTIGERVLRAAMVTVSSGATSNGNDDSASNAEADAS
ncbi:Heat-inducible transcription repressor HrcA [Durusdinium trenchii]|uniref:GrpE protein homolog n=1 Tax=Durusdinium trenchii TaxID=1381693 RepID=A0ABP0LKY9_9DINO